MTFDGPDDGIIFNGPAGDIMFDGPVGDITFDHLTFDGLGVDGHVCMEALLLDLIVYPLQGLAFNVYHPRIGKAWKLSYKN